MKFRLTLIFTLLLALLWSTDVMATAKDTINVRTPKEFMDAVKANRSDAVIKVTHDLDFDNYDISSVDVNGIEITGKRDSYSYSSSETPYFCLKNISSTILYNAKNAYIHNLCVSGATTNMIWKATNCTFEEMLFEKCGKKKMASIVTHLDYNCTFDGLTFIGCSIFSACREVGTHSADSYPAGLISCYSRGSTASNLLATSKTQLYGQSGHVGTFFGASYGLKMTDCTSSAIVMGYDDSLGGMVGSTSNSYDGTNYGNSTFTRCTFNGMIKHVNFSNDLDDFLEGVDASNDTYMLSKVKGVPLDAISVVTFPSTVAAQGAISAFEASTLVEYTAGIKQICDAGLTNGLVVGWVDGFTKWAAGVNYAKYAAGIYKFAVAFNFVWTVYGIYSLACDLCDWGINASGPDQTGGMAGYAKNATFSACANYGNIYSLDAYCGGIVGYGENVAIDNCLNDGTARGGEQTGGIAGRLQGSSSLKYNLNVGNISCSNDNTAGVICGQYDSSVTWLDNCYSALTSEISDNPNGGSVYKVSQKDLVSGKAANWLQTKNTALGRDSVWFQSVCTNGDHFPTLNAAHDKAGTINESLSTTINVETGSGLVGALVNPYSDVNITADIDLSDVTGFNLTSKNMPFCGKIEGNGHTISNASFSQTGKTYTFNGMESFWQSCNWVGFLGGAENATFSNFNLKNFTLDMSTNVSNVGLFVGHSKNCTYTNVNLIGNSAITESDGEEHYEEIIGGLVGGSEKTSSPTVL